VFGEACPGYLKQFDALKKAGVDEVWCVATNDAFVMAHWAASKSARQDSLSGRRDGRVVEALGLEQGGREWHANEAFFCAGRQRPHRQLNVEEPGKFEVSDADTLLKQLA